MKRPWVHMSSPSRSPLPTSLPTHSLQVLPEHQVRALVSCIQPGPVICFTLDSIHAFSKLNTLRSRALRVPFGAIYWPCWESDGVSQRGVLIHSETNLKNLATALADSFFLHRLGGDQIVKRADIKYIAVIQLLSSVQFSRSVATPWIAACQASITNSWSLPKLMSIKSVMPSSHLILCLPLLLLSPILPSIRVFSSESTLHIRWPKYWSFSFDISPFNEHPGLISFRMDWLDLLAVQGTLKSLLQHHSSKASILRRSAFFTVQLSHPYMTSGKTRALTRRTFVGKVMSLLLNTLSRLIITFLPRRKHLLISWLQSPICSDFGATQNKVWHHFHCFPIYFPWSDGTGYHDLSFLNVEL